MRVNREREKKTHLSYPTLRQTYRDGVCYYKNKTVTWFIFSIRKTQYELFTYLPTEKPTGNGLS